MSNDLYNVFKGPQKDFSVNIYSYAVQTYFLESFLSLNALSFLVRNIAGIRGGLMTPMSL